MSKVVRCDFNNPPPNGMFCDIDIRAFGPCSKENYYGYKNGRPCVFLKLSTNPSWTPEFYDASHLPETMPDDLKNHIMNAINGDPFHTVGSKSAITAKLNLFFLDFCRILFGFRVGRRMNQKLLTLDLSSTLTEGSPVITSLAQVNLPVSRHSLQFILKDLEVITEYLTDPSFVN